MKIYAVHDSKVEAFLQPFFVPTNGAAIRAMTDLVNDLGHTFNKHTMDFSLFYLGEFDEQSGLLKPEKAPKVVTILIDLKEMEQ